MSTFKTDLEKVAPMVHELFLSGQPGEKEFIDFLEGMRKWLERQKVSGLKSALIIDPRGITKFDASLRTAYGNWRVENMELIGQTLSRAGYVTESTMWRGILTAIFWFAKPIIPVKTFADKQSARTWIDEKGDTEF